MRNISEKQKQKLVSKFIFPTNIRSINRSIKEEQKTDA